MGTFARAVRLCEMMVILQERWYSVAELAVRYNISPRVIRRDLVALELDPFWCPLCHDDNGLVRLVPPCEKRRRERWVPSVADQVGA
jgi:hypothetical protein